MDKKDQAPRQSREELLKRNNTTPEDVKKAHDQADQDIASDADFDAPTREDDLDEGESARVGKE